MRKYFCGLDELFDTRLGLMSMIDEEKAAEAIAPPKQEYLYRMHDSFLYETVGISKEEWDEKWLHRNHEVLTNSVRTHIPTLITQSTMEYMENPEESLASKDVSLDINTYPYEFSDEEKNVLKEVLQQLIPMLQKINYVHYSMKALTVNVLKEYDECYLYDYHRWMDIHGGSLKGQYFTGLNLFVPRLFYKKVSDEEWQKVSKTEVGRWIINQDIFKATESILSSQFQLTHIAASDFSAAIFDLVKKSTTVPDLDQSQSQYVFETVDTTLSDHQSSSHR